MEAAPTNRRNGYELSGQVIVDRTWGQTLGVHRARGARRVGNLYKVPKVEYLRLVREQARLNPADSPCFDWTAGDDLAVEELIDSSRTMPCGN